MASLSDKISMLTDPTPRLLDPEDDDDDHIDSLKVNKYSGDSNETLFARSELRSKAAVISNFQEYTGKKVSRKSLHKFFHDDEEVSSKYDKESDELSRETDEDLEYNENDQQYDEEEEDSDLENFKTSVKKAEIPSDEESEEDEEESVESEASDVESNEGLRNKFSNIDVTSEVEKGAAVKAQQELWFKLCEARIKLQKLIIISNRLPQYDCWSTLKKNVGKDMLQCINKGSNSVKYLVNALLNLQSEISHKIIEISSVNQETDKQSDEEICSDLEDEIIEDQRNKNKESVNKTVKRKLKCDEYGDVLSKRHKSFIPDRNAIISKWDEKTKLSSGRITQKSFNISESSALKQIDQILQDESRIIKRTQLKRSLYKILGKPDDSEIKLKETEKNEFPPKQDMMLRCYDVEIFDDDDFYRQILREIIESKSVGIDPTVLRKQMEIQNVRNKIKKKVDTKASKGRKIRYDVHPKLVGFMKKMSTTTLPDDARENLLKKMFGRG